VTSRLSEYERGRFEGFYLSIPQNREKVKIAKALLVYLTQEQLQEKPTSVKIGQQLVSLLHSIKASLSNKTPVLRLAALVSILAMVFVSSWMVLKNNNLRTQFDQVQRERGSLLQREQELTQQFDEQRKQNEQMAEQLLKEQNQLTELQRILREQSIQSREPLTFALIPGASRGTNDFKRSQIAQDEQLVRILLYVEKQKEYDNYRALLLTAEGDTVLSQYQLQTEETEKGGAIALLVPSSLLTYNDYLITVYGQLPSKEIEFINSFSLNITK
ncbi:MAG: hypothetical protein MN733_01815, partial [Nitrososphaera sp.]|nr:hypothetical protein [Nitrososphaera sp.]